MSGTRHCNKQNWRKSSWVSLFGSILGSLVAGVLIGLVESVGGLLIDPSYKLLIVFGLYLAIVAFRPKGLFGRY